MIEVFKVGMHQDDVFGRRGIARHNGWKITKTVVYDKSGAEMSPPFQTKDVGDVYQTLSCGVTLGFSPSSDGWRLSEIIENE